MNKFLRIKFFNHLVPFFSFKISFWITFRTRKAFFDTMPITEVGSVLTVPLLLYRQVPSLLTAHIKFNII